MLRDRLEFSSARIPWTPKVLGSSLVGWWMSGVGLYDATSGGNLVTTNGTKIGRWEDQSGNGNHLTMSSGTDYPTWPRLATSIQNGYSALQCAKTSFPSTMTNSSTTMTRNTSRYTLVVVHAIDSSYNDSYLGYLDVGGNAINGYANSTDLTNWSIVRNSASTTVLVDQYGSGYYQMSAHGKSLSGARKFCIAINSFNYENGLSVRSYNGGTRFGCCNPVENAVRRYMSGQWITDKKAPSGTTTATLSILASHLYLEAMVVHDSSYDIIERIEGYLAHKYGMTNSLPANHKYSRNPPYCSDKYEWPIQDGLQLYLDGNKTSSNLPDYYFLDISGNFNFFWCFSSQKKMSGGTGGIGYVELLTPDQQLLRTTENNAYFSRGEMTAYSDSTLMVWSRLKDTTAADRVLMTVTGASNSITADKQIMIKSGSDELLGSYDGSSTQFYSSGFSAYSIPNENTKFNCLTFKLSQSSPYLSFQVNDNTTKHTITNANASFTTNWSALGSVSDRYLNMSRHWGDISLVLYYNRPLTDDEILKNYDTFRRRFDL